MECTGLVGIRNGDFVAFFHVYQGCECQLVASLVPDVGASCVWVASVVET